VGPLNGCNRTTVLNCVQQAARPRSTVQPSSVSSGIVTVEGRAPSRRPLDLPYLLHTAKKKAPDVSVRCLFRLGFGRRDWTRTNDPHHVKVVL
jgi:hypothetical protein